jgi:hypothetical protein
MNELEIHQDAGVNFSDTTLLSLMITMDRSIG